MKATERKYVVLRALFTFILTTSVGIVSIVNANYTNLHAFAGGSNDGQYPYGNLTLSGNTLYGMTRYGGGNSMGVIFKINTDGNNYTNLHDFAGGNDDGQEPYGNLTLSGSTLYGMTYSGGDNNYGVIFKMDMDGNNYTNLHDFAGGNDDGRNPFGNLILSNSTLYGMTYNGGDSSMGVIFKMNTDGNNYTNLHDFAGGNDDGRRPFGDLTLSGSTLYGMTYNGGDNDSGIIFKMNTDGNNYTNLHDFVGGTDDGSYPQGSLNILSESVLYGMTRYGGGNSRGVIFKMDIDGNNYTNLHDFAGGSDGGQNPCGSLILSGDSFAGMTYYGGDDNDGVLFRIRISGDNYTNLHEFAGGNDDGQNPYFGSILEYNGFFYGMTYNGGDNNSGVIFKQTVPEPVIFGLALIVSGLFIKLHRS